MTTADHHTDFDQDTRERQREHTDYTDRGDASGFTQHQADEQDRMGTDAQDADTRGMSDPTLTDASATTPAEAAAGDAGHTEGSYASRHAEQPSAASGDGTPAAATSGDKLERLVPTEQVEEYTVRWERVKGEFVDEPRQAVAKADALVGELLDELDQLFRKQRSDLEHGLDADETSTEDLRLALRRYRSFFDRLLAL